MVIRGLHKKLLNINMKKYLLFVIGFICILAQLQAQNILQTKPRLMYNYTLFTDSVFAIDYKKLPEGARPQLTDDIKAVAKKQLIQFTDRGDSIDRFWYVNNTCFTQCKFVVYQNKKVVEEILFWPNAESVEVDTKLLNPTKYVLQIWLDNAILEKRDAIIGGKD